MKQASVFANEIAQKENDDSLASIKASGKTEVYVLTKEEREVWRKQMMSVHKDAETRVGKETIQAIYKEAEALGFKFD